MKLAPASHITQRRAFSMLEMAVAVTLVAIAAGIVGLRWQRLASTRAPERLHASLRALDAQARLMAEREGRSMLLQMTDDCWRLEGSTISHSIPLPDKAEVWTAAGPVSQLTVHPDGTTSSYVWHIYTSDDIRWLAVAGLSGQCVELQSKEEADAFLGR